jgi:prolyl-tRNA editing enzyme YbaK/EbsC (Cys-tRNA(Pro) deacylase)
VQPMTPADVQSALDQFNLNILIRHFDSLTATSQQAADSIGCELGQIVKSLAFIVDGQPVLVLASGDQRVDDRKLADLHTVSRKKIKIATPEECIAIYGYAPGGVPPIGHRTAHLPTYIDNSLARYEQLYAAAGAPNAIFPVTLAQLELITDGKVVDLVRTESTSA